MMTSVLSPIDRSAPASSVVEALGPEELGSLVSSFNEIASRVQGAHEALLGEVTVLRRELAGANEELERSRRLAGLGEMAAGIAHEVRNPLASIRLHARLLEQDLGDRPEQRSLAEKILRAVSGLDAIVGDVLSFAKDIRVRPEEVCAGDLFDRAIEEAIGPRSPVPRVARAPGCAGMRIVCDPDLTHRALVNVLRNAADAVEGRGDGAIGVGASVGRAREPSGRTRRVVSLAVRDNGPGIPEELRARLFNPFFTTRSTGAGLGLAIVARIMDAHGGRVRIGGGPAVAGRGSAGGAGQGGGAGALVELLFPSPADVAEKKENAA